MTRAAAVLAASLALGLALAAQVEDVTPKPARGAPTPLVCEASR